MYRRILVPLDSSATSQRGLQEAIQLAKAFDASLVLLHVVEYFPMMVDITSTAVLEQVSSQMRSAGKDLLQRAHDAARSAGVACETQLEDVAGVRVCDVVVQQAKDRRCDLIVMGTHGRRGVEHALLGSDAERVLRLAPCAVLLVKAAATK
jgi:nucleotide-binding universal stress UspA family protein